MTLFAAAFMMGAIVTFSLAALAGMVSRVTALPFVWRAGFAAAILGALGVVDLLAIKKACYCPLGKLRQTPKSLLYRRSISTVAAAWGFDAGLAVTTIRVAAITWGALVMTALGVASWWAGFGYGLGFVGPLLILIWKQAPPAAQSSMEPSLGSGLEGLLRQRPVAQSASALLLFAAGAVLVIRTFLAG